MREFANSRFDREKPNDRDVLRRRNHRQKVFILDTQMGRGLYKGPVALEQI